MAKLSRREAWAAKTGRPKSEYKKSAEGQAVGDIKDYYKELGKQTEKRHEFNKEKLKEDFELIMKEAGYDKEDLLADYSRNIKRLEEDKSTDIEELNYYLGTTRGRTQEDLDVALEKESRTHSLLMDREQESLAARNLVFSGFGGIRGKEEGQLTEAYESKVADYMRESKRSFQDLDRMEQVKNLAIEQRYGRAEEETETGKERGLRNIELGGERAETSLEQGIETSRMARDVTAFGQKRARGTAISGITSQFDEQRLREQYEKPLWNTLMS